MSRHLFYSILSILVYLLYLFSLDGHQSFTTINSYMRACVRTVQYIYSHPTHFPFSLSFSYLFPAISPHPLLFIPPLSFFCVGKIAQIYSPLHLGATRCDGF